MIEDIKWEFAWHIGRRIGILLCRVLGHTGNTWGSHTTVAPDGTYTHEEGWWCSRCLSTHNATTRKKAP